MNPILMRRLAACIQAGGPFTADDVTATGTVTADGDHRPNASQNKIGALIQHAAARGLIVWTGNTQRSNAPHRKGGLIRIWVGTPYGRDWAARLLDEEPECAP